MKRKATIRRTLTLNAYEIISRAVDEGVAYGWMRAHKYVDKPDEQMIKGEIEDAVMGAISEVVDWTEGEG